MGLESPPTLTVWRVLQAVSAEGERFDLEVRLAPPEPDGADAKCWVALTRLLEPPVAVYGVDGWQAVTLALKLADSLLADFQKRGGCLVWPEGTGETYEAALALARRP